MNDQKPVCLIVAAAYPAIVAVYLAFCFLFLPHVDVHNGGLPANFGTGLVIAAIFGLFYLIGFIFLIASFIRSEPYRKLAFLCLAFYILPPLFLLLASLR